MTRVRDHDDDCFAPLFSFITAIELLGNPAEMYSHGTQFWMTCCAFLIVVPVASHCYVPVFMTLRLTSSYEYLEMRFSWTARLLASALYVLQMVLYTSVAVYAPALALSHVTGLNTYVAVTVVYLVCVFYSSQGGMKAVIMTDTFQAAVLIGSILLILGIGDHFQGGPSMIWDLNKKAERIEFFNVDPNPTTRHTLWSVVIGGSFYWLSMFCANQASIQKYLSVESLAQARSALWVSAAFLIGIFTVNFYTGAILFAEYRDCDPVRSNVAIATNALDTAMAPTSVAGCPCINESFSAAGGTGHLMSLVTAVGQDEPEDSVFALYRLSYLWYTMLGTVVTVVVGLVVSALTTPQDPCTLHPDLLAPPVRTFLAALPNSIKEILNLPIEV
ncbi:hypothetical protein FOCC_FOCC016900, partial [Frankliniella occidentalis]